MPTLSPPDPACHGTRHGTRQAYARSGCRCPAAKAAEYAYRKRLRCGRQPSALVDATGTTRRLQALARIGWTAELLAPRLQMNVGEVRRIRLGRPRVFRHTAERVNALYRHLLAVPGPSREMAAGAKGRGWVSPLAWGDDIDDPHARPVGPGRPRTRKPASRRGPSPEDKQRYLEQVRALWLAGKRDVDIAAAVGRRPDAVRRFRQRHGLTGDRRNVIQMPRRQPRRATERAAA